YNTRHSGIHRMEENLKQATADIIKIAIIGPECTGKTTLAKDLADHFADPWVPEFARDFLQEKFNKTGKICEQEDMLPIVRGHVQQENAAVASAKKYLFADTCALQSKVYSDIYYGSVDAAIAKAARKHRYDLFFLTAVDVPWEKDDLRDRPNDRQNYFQIFRDARDEAENPSILSIYDVSYRHPIYTGSFTVL